MTLRSLLFFILGILTFPLHNRSWAGEEIKLSVATSVRQNIFQKIQDPFEKQTGLKLLISKFEGTPASTQYFEDLINGKVEAAAASLSYSAWVDLMKEKKINIPREKEITFRTIGHDLMAVLANPKLGVKKMSAEQVENIFTGKIKNWKDLGGANVKPLVVLIKTKLSNNSSFQKLAMGGKAFPADAKYVESLDELLSTITETPGAVGFESKSTPPKSAAIIETQTIGRPSTLITYGRPSANMQKLIDFILKEGRNFGVGQ